MKLILIAASFGVISLAAKQIGASLQKYKLPLISGYLLAGILAGPFVLKLLTQESISQLLFIDEIALAFIAFAAGNELISGKNTKTASRALVG